MERSDPSTLPALLQVWSFWKFCTKKLFMALPLFESLIVAHVYILTRFVFFFTICIWMIEVEIGREYGGTHLYHIYCKIKDWIHGDNTYIYYLIKLVHMDWWIWAPFLIDSLSTLFFLLGHASLPSHLFFLFLNAWREREIINQYSEAFIFQNMAIFVHKTSIW